VQGGENTSRKTSSATTTAVEITKAARIVLILGGELSVLALVCYHRFALRKYYSSTARVSFF